MALRHDVLGILLLGLFACAAPLLSSARAADLEAAAREQTALYERNRDGTSWRNLKARQDALCKLGTLDTPTARQTLFDVVTQRRPLGDQLVALKSIGAILDARTTAALVKEIGRKGTAPTFLVTLSDALSNVRRDDAKAWLATEGVRLKRSELLLACVDALADLPLPAARERLEEIYRDTERTTRGVDLAHGAIRALGLIGAPESRTTLRAAAVHRDFRIRLAAADVLALQDELEDEDWDILRGLLVDEHGVVTRAAIAAIASSGTEAFINELAPLLETDRLRTREVAHDALVALAGKDIGWSPGRWQKWLQKRDDPDAEDFAERPYDHGTYHGFALLTDRVVFIVDISGSMTWPWRDKHPKRFVAAKKELSRALVDLRRDTLFNVLAFNDKVKPWKKGEQRAEPRTVEAATRWIANTFSHPGGETNSFGVLEQAFRDNPDADTIFLLSDGAPNGGEFDEPEAIVAHVKRWNRYRRTAVNTIALTLANLDRGTIPIGQDVGRMERLMQDLAATTGGAYRLVEDVPLWMVEIRED